MNLPEDFLLSMKELLGTEYEAFLDSYNSDSFCGLRVNTSKISVEEFVRIAPYAIEPISFVENGFYINETDAWTKHPYYFAGLYYIQEPSAMLPANILPIENGDCVLDLCAAPGGKSTELGTKAECKLFSNDISFSRTIPLVKNLEYAGVRNMFVTSETPSKLKNEFFEYFDKILVDAPCSGEGMFRKDKKLINEYITRKPSDYSKLQKEILSDAVTMLKPGGLLLYSTCTFSPLEDEEVIDFILADNNLELLDIKEIDGSFQCYEKYLNSSSGIEKCIHIFPHRVKGEGHFIALLRKKGFISEEIHKTNKPSKDFLTFDKLPKEAVDFLNCIICNKRRYEEESYYIIKDSMIFMIDKDFADAYRRGLHYTRTGSIIGVLGKNGGFIPHTALALSIKSSQFDNVCDFSLDDPLVCKYLKGETLIISDESKINNLKKGFVLITVDGFSLGFAKFDGNKFKNLYEKGWRLN